MRWFSRTVNWSSDYRCEKKSTRILISLALFFSLFSSREKKKHDGAHACTHTAQWRATYKKKLEAENHPRRSFQSLKLLLRRSAERISRVSKPLLCTLRPGEEKKKTSRPEIVVAAKTLFLFPFWSTVFSRLWFFSIFLWTRVHAWLHPRGAPRWGWARESFRQRRVLPTMNVVNGRNLYDPRKQITGATLTSRSITLGRTPTSAF